MVLDSDACQESVHHETVAAQPVHDAHWSRALERTHYVDKDE